MSASLYLFVGFFADCVSYSQGVNLQDLTFPFAFMSIMSVYGIICKLNIVKANSIAGLLKFEIRQPSSTSYLQFKTEA